jgi:hypothetical protein
MEVDEVITLLTPEQFAAFTDSTSSSMSKIVEAKIKNGVDSHNFCDGEIDTRTTDKDIKQFANQILEYPTIAGEILYFIEEFNRPLARETSKTLGMSQNGSITEQSSSGEIDSLTEESLPS